jgi:cell division protein FtsQ
MKRKIFRLLGWALLISYLFIAMSFVNNEKSNTVCSELKIIVNKPHSFIDSETVENLLISNNVKMYSCLIDNINFDFIENIIESNPAVKSAEAYSNFLGEVFIDITQRNPIMRIITNKNKHYYIDDQFKLMPVSRKYSANVPVISGNIGADFIQHIDSSENSQTILSNYSFTPQELFDFVSYINQDNLWKCQIEQIYINDDKEVELVPRVGNHIIIMGDLNNYEYKLKKLSAVYKKGFALTDWNIYSSINLKYSNQVICKKR